VFNLWINGYMYKLHYRFSTAEISQLNNFSLCFCLNENLLNKKFNKILG